MTSNSTSSLVTLLRSRRAELGLSLSEVARRAQLDKGVLSRTETGQNPRVSPGTLRALARALELPLSDIMTAANLLPAAELPTLRPYMRAKYADLPDTAVDEVERFIADLQQRHGHGPATNEDEGEED